MKSLVVSKRLIARRLAALTLAAAPTVAAAAAPVRPIAYAQPADHVKVGPLARLPGAVIMADGRVSAPVGLHRAVDASIVAAGLSRNGRYLVTVERAGDAAYVATFIAKTLAPAARLLLPGPAVGGGLTITPDPTAPQHRELITISTGLTGGVAFVDLEADGTLRLDAVPSAALSNPNVAHFAGTMASSKLGAQAFVLDELGGTVTPVNLHDRRFGISQYVGFAPHGAARIGSQLVVLNEGVESPLPLPVHEPLYPLPPADLSHASSAAMLDLPPEPLGPPAEPRPAFGAPPVPIPMDPTPQNVTVGGAHPTAVVGYAGVAYVALANVDRIATIALSRGKVVGGTELRFFDRGPYGTQPVALALDPAHSRLYVALSGIDAIAVLDITRPNFPHRLGLLPSVHLPTALSFDRKYQALYITGQAPLGNAQHGMLQRIDLHSMNLASATAAALRNVRRVVFAPMHAHAGGRVVQIRMPAATYDDVFAAGAPYGNTVMPILHRLAQQNLLATNFYSSARGPLAADQLGLAGQILPSTARTERIGSARRWEGSPPALGYDDAPRYGYIFDALTRAEIPYRNYGLLPTMARYAPFSDAGYAQALASGRATECATEFVRDHVVNSSARYISIALPDLVSHAGEPAAREADAALGTIIEALQHDPQWPKTTLIISPWRAVGHDAVDPQHTYAVIIAPSVRRPRIYTNHRSLESLLKSEEALLGLAPLTLGDLLISPFDLNSAGVSGSNG